MFGLFVIVLVKRVVKLLHNVLHNACDIHDFRFT